MRQRVRREYEKIFGDGGEAREYFAPGRVNLIGDHTDYNGGHVFPCAINLGTYGMAEKRSDNKLCFYSVNFPEAGIVSADFTKLRREKNWADYPKGVIQTFGERGMELPCGLNMLLCGNLPHGSGLSSSASVEVLTGYILRDLFGFDVTNEELAKIGQYSENNFNGVNCGIMDQFAIAMGKKGQAVFLDTSALSYEYVPVSLLQAAFVITCSNVKRELGESAYNERRAESERALADLQQVIGIRTLGDMTGEMFEVYQSAVRDEVCRRRARHAVYENQRTIQAKEALKRKDVETVGRLMNESHRSLSEDYEVTGDTMDTLVGISQAQPGVWGSRITGAGFGGCTVSLVQSGCVEAFQREVGKKYTEKTGLRADFYAVEIADGPVVL